LNNLALTQGFQNSVLLGGRRKIGRDTTFKKAVTYLVEKKAREKKNGGEANLRGG
jgi:hypothetical protein